MGILTRDTALGKPALKKSKYVEDARKWWGIAHALDGERLHDALGTVAVREYYWVKSVELLKSKYGLGVALRMILIRDVVRGGKELKWFYDNLYELDKEDILPGRHDFENAMRLNNDTQFPRKFNHPSVPELLATLLDKVSPGLSERISASDLFTKGFHGPRAIDDYLRWLSGATAQQDAFVDGMTLPKFVGNTERESVINRLRQLLAPKAAAKMVINLHQRGMWQGLRAMVPEIAGMRAENDHRAILHIPLVSHSKAFIAPSPDYSPGLADMAQTLDRS